MNHKVVVQVLLPGAGLRQQQARTDRAVRWIPEGQLQEKNQVLSPTVAGETVKPGKHHRAPGNLNRPKVKKTRMPEMAEDDKNVLISNLKQIN